MNSGRKDYRDIIGFEGLYTINKFGSIKALPRKVKTSFGENILKQNTPIVKANKGVNYTILRNSEYKNVKINVDRMIKNIFGRQKPIYINKKVEPKRVVEKIKKPINHNGSRGIEIEQINNGEIIRSFSSFTKAALAMHVDLRHISDAVYGVKKFAAGFEWRIKNSNNK